MQQTFSGSALGALDQPLDQRRNWNSGEDNRRCAQKKGWGFFSSLNDQDVFVNEEFSVVLNKLRRKTW